ncbi:VanZ family protein [Streptomyces sp. NPDC008122]|uniref:VanZ family protein n=1 Tax=Streptomyces sp. NPDC008122 TaxID=3364810 RepID=UPI0036E27A77
MIEAAFQDHLTFLALAIAGTFISGALVYLVAAPKMNKARAAQYGLWASSTVGPITLTSYGGSGLLTYTCTINPDFIESFTETQWQLNVVLFIPFGFFASLATRRPIFGAAIGVLFTASIETAQATVPFISRLCDTDDLVANSIGVLLGSAIGAIAYRRLRDSEPIRARAARNSLAVGAVALVAIAATWAVVIEPVRAVLPTEVPTASKQQLQALNTSLEELFGDSYRADWANFHNNIDAPSTVNAPLPGGFAELEWPSKEKLSVHFTPTLQSDGNSSTYHLPGASRPAANASQAQDIALKFARKSTPWALRGSKVRVSQIDPGSDALGWVVEWRRWKGDLLMPMRLDIAIEPSGGITDLIARNVADPEVPAVRIGKAGAWKAFDAFHKIHPEQSSRQEPIYLMELRENSWRVHWRLSARDENTMYSATVDATTGAVVANSTAPVQEGAIPSAPEGLNDVELQAP